ncbi:hypothetical protein CTA2_8990 [Colletotrichum tanaceti]|uniref:Wax synthase domain-containing protein n=1 Tax=Colletotrichum tanaceti TaxID=1306861 RepID=A0A4U6X5Y9_9PEZI|nr:hypothetical protein CTA2_8990 [Colletotrichum tanaceti]TKW50413.1 hypothetical protein CTA1_8292 [Colletotrichum tanaceti]
MFLLRSCCNMAAIILFAWPVGWFFSSALFFFLGLRHESRRPRTILAALHVLAVAAGLGAMSDKALRELPLLAVPFVVGVTAHTTSILLLDEGTSTAGLDLSAQLKVTTLLWCDIRRLVREPREPCGARPTSAATTTTTTTGATPGCQGRISFCVGRLSRTLVLWLVDRAISEILLPRTLRSLPLGIHSFAPDKRTVLPSPWTSPGLAYSDYVLRVVTSTHWIWTTYCGLTTMHNLSAALFVSVLHWDSPSNWAAGPPLFGSVWDAYTLRRFWGVFWHRLHVVPFSAYTPPPLPKAPRALWVFLLSAAGHALVNWVMHRRAHAASEFRFFVLNWAVCLCEHVLGVDGGGTPGRLASKPPPRRRPGESPASFSCGSSSFVPYRRGSILESMIPLVR